MDATAYPHRLRRLPTVEVASHRVPVAVTFLSRLLGLALLRPERAGEGLLIPRCHSVHTFGMRFALDVRFLDHRGAALSLRSRVPANRLLREPAAAAVLEVPAAGSAV